MSGAMSLGLVDKHKEKNGKTKQLSSFSPLTHSRTVYGSSVETLGPYSRNYMSAFIKLIEL
jgi:hypothetical protein